MSLISDKLAVFSLIFTMLSVSVAPHPLILLITYALHELGHLFFASVVGAKIKRFKLGAFHLSLCYDCTELSYKRELLVSLGGIIFNLVSGSLVLVIPFLKGEVITYFVLCNFSLAIMNLYPASVLDGNGALKSFLYLLLPQERADKILGGVSIIAILLIWLVSVYFQLIFSSNLSLLIISIVLLVELCFSVAK